MCWLGPQGLLLIGFSEADSTAVEGWMHRMEPTFVVSHCTAPMLDATLEEAVCDKSSGGFRRESFVRVDEVLPRLVLLSGMTGEESVAIAEHWEHFTGAAQEHSVSQKAQLVSEAAICGSCNLDTRHDAAVTCMH